MVGPQTLLICGARDHPASLIERIDAFFTRHWARIASLPHI